MPYPKQAQISAKHTPFNKKSKVRSSTVCSCSPTQSTWQAQSKNRSFSASLAKKRKFSHKKKIINLIKITLYQSQAIKKHFSTLHTSSNFHPHFHEKRPTWKRISNCSIFLQLEISSRERGKTREPATDCFTPEGRLDEMKLNLAGKRVIHRCTLTGRLAAEFWVSVRVRKCVALHWNAIHPKGNAQSQWEGECECEKWESVFVWRWSVYRRANRKICTS